MYIIKKTHQSFVNICEVRTNFRNNLLLYFVYCLNARKYYYYAVFRL